MGKWNWKQREKMNGNKTTLLGHYIECQNPKCQMLFNANKTEQKKVGFLRFCSDQCWRVYKDLSESNSREQK